MKKLADKLRKQELVISVKKQRLTEEAKKLDQIRKEKILAVSELKKYQNEYLTGIDRLNEERQSSGRQMVAGLEDSIDFAKQCWYDCLAKVKKIEESEKIQIGEVLAARSTLKSIEYLKEKVENEIVDLRKVAEQKQTDEMAVLKHGRKPD